MKYMQTIYKYKNVHNYKFYSDVLPLSSSRSGTKFATKSVLIKCRRASMVCFRIVIMYIIHINVVCMYEYLHGDDPVSCRL